MNHAIPVICRTDTGAPLLVEQVEKCLAASGIDRDKSHGTRRRSRRMPRHSGASDNDIARALTDGEPSGSVQKRLLDALANCHGTDRHNTIRNDVFALLAMGLHGEPGVRHALAAVKDVFVNAVAPDRPGGEAEAANEFDRFVFSGRVAELVGTNGFGAAAVDTEFWSSTAPLDHILRFSRARGAAPYPVLGAVLRRAVGCVDPHVVLPAMVGGEASLNLFTATVGRSGAGKDAANSAGHDAVTFFVGMGDSGRIPMVDAQYLHPGTGEGLVRCLMPDAESASSGRGHLQVSDVATLEALAGRQGQTLHATLLSGWMGQPLGFRNNARHTSTAVNAHAYRLCLSVGVQPENADFFLSREKDGLPQRFLWLPATDPGAPRNRPAEEGSLEVLLPPFPVGPEPKFVFEVPSGIQEMVRMHRHGVLIGDTSIDPLDGHIILTQLKVAAGLSILHGELAITDEMWLLADHLIDVSAQVRAQLREASKIRRDKANMARAHDWADRQLVGEARLSDRRRERAQRAILNRLKRAGAQDRRNLQQACDSTVRAAFGDALDDLIQRGEVIVDTSCPAMHRLADM